MAKGGNPNVTLRSDFVRVVFVDPLEVQEENATADNITSHHSGVNREALQLNNEQGNPIPVIFGKSAFVY